jgi:hypothetical protein
MKTHCKYYFITVLLLFFFNNGFTQINFDGATRTNYKILFCGEEVEVISQFIVKRGYAKIYEKGGVGYPCFYLELVLKSKINHHDFENDEFDSMLKFYDKDGELIHKTTYDYYEYKEIHAKKKMHIYSFNIRKLPLGLFDCVKTISISFEEDGIFT